MTLRCWILSCLEEWEVAGRRQNKHGIKYPLQLPEVAITYVSKTFPRSLSSFARGEDQEKKRKPTWPGSKVDELG